jgi:basic membrane lipoprotein Med (substrate-binding protein (PBP1-ABC) superfamily)
MDRSRDIVFMADYGNVMDKSFNQQGYEATRDFAKSVDMSYGDLEPGRVSRFEFKKRYEDVFGEQAQMLVMSGFAHEPS